MTSGGDTDPTLEAFLRQERERRLKELEERFASLAAASRRIQQSDWTLSAFKTRETMRRWQEIRDRKSFSESHLVVEKSGRVDDQVAAEVTETGGTSSQQVHEFTDQSPPPVASPPPQGVGASFGVYWNMHWAAATYGPPHRGEPAPAAPLPPAQQQVPTPQKSEVTADGDLRPYPRDHLQAPPPPPKQTFSTRDREDNFGRHDASSLSARQATGRRTEGNKSDSHLARNNQKSEQKRSLLLPIIIGGVLGYMAGLTIYSGPPASDTNQVSAPKKIFKRQIPQK